MRSGKKWDWMVLSGGLAAIASCQAEVGEEYTGEVLLSLGGSVVAGPEVPHDHELALVFPSYTAAHVHLVDGETTGEFPSRFRFEVTTPPPDELIFLQPTGVHDPYARGALVLVPKNHPTKVPRLNHLMPSLEPTGAEVYTVDVSRCTDEYDLPPGQQVCVEERFVCSSHACELEMDTATPEMLEDEHPTEFSHLSNSEGEQCTHTEYCTLDGCGHRLWCCDLPEAGPGERVQALEDATQYSVCKSEGATGDPELVELVELADDMRVAATDLRVIYFEHDQPAESAMSQFKRGYTIVDPHRMPGAQLAWVLCEADARSVAFAEYAAEYGQRYKPSGRAWQDDPTAKRIISARLEELMEECGDFSGTSELFHQGAQGLEITVGAWEPGQ